MTEQGNIFISYRTLEADFALRLAADLKNVGVRMWIDRLDIKPGDDWRLRIEEAVNTCGAMITILSPDYVASRYCRRELDRADTMGVPIFPILLSTITDRDWPMEVQSIQYIDFRDWRDERVYRQKLDVLLKQLQKHISAQIGDSPDPETRYLISLIADMEARKGVLEYVDLAAQTRLLRQETEQIRPKPPFAETWGIDGDFVLLEDKSSVGSRAEHSPRNSSKNIRKRADSILQVVSEHDRFVLVGKPGAGKTTVIRRLALDAARARLENPRSAPLPLLLYLPTWSEDSSPVDFIRTHWPFQTDPIPLLNSGNALLYLDGLNEMGEEGATKTVLLRDWLYSRQGPKKTIITCRIDDYTGKMNLGLPVVVTEEMDEKRIKEFVTNYLSDDAAPFLARILPNKKNDREDNFHLLQLARNPYLLTAMVVVYKNSPGGDLPHNSGALFNQLVMALWDRERRRQTHGWVPFEEMEAAFSRLAFAMIDHGKPNDVPQSYALKYLDNSTLLRTGANANIIEVREKKVRFFHHLMQEYFAAAELYRTGLQDILESPQILGHHKRPAGKWDQVIVALCGILPNADITICEISGIDPYLAAMCIGSGINVSSSVRQKTVDTLLTELLNEKSEICRAAAEALGEIRDTATVHGLLKTLHNEYQRFDEYVGIALKKIGSPAFFTLVEILSDKDSDTRKEAIKALGLMEDARAIPHLLEVLYDESYWTRRAAANSLNMLYWQPPDDKSRVVYFIALGRWQKCVAMGTAAVPGLIEGLKYKDWRVRKKAAIALGDIKDPTALPYLCNALCDVSISVKRAAVTALGEIGDAGAVRSLVDILKEKEQDSRLRQNAAIALGMIGNPNAVPSLLANLNDPKWYVRQDIVNALARIKDESAVHALLGAQSDNHELVRIAIVRALGQFQDAVATTGIIKFLADENKWVRKTAAEELGKLRTVAAVPDLLKLLYDDKKRVVRKAAKNALARMGDTVVEGLLKSLAVNDWQKRKTAVELLRKIGNAAAVFILICKGLKDENRRVRKAAARALKKIDKEIVLAQFKKVLKDKSTHNQAIKRLKNIDKLTVSDLIHSFIPDDDNRPTTFREKLQEGWGTTTKILGEAVDVIAGGLKQIQEATINKWFDNLRDELWHVYRGQTSEIPIPEFLDELREKVWQPLITAIKTLEETGSGKPEQESIAALRNEDNPIYKALELLAVLTAARSEGEDELKNFINDMKSVIDASVIRNLLAALHDQDELLRQKAAKRLGETGNVVVIPSLLIALGDKDSGVRRNAARALGEIGKPAAVPVLREALQDKDKQVRTTTITALKQIGTSEALAAIDEIQSSVQESPEETTT
jgi:HEAT repeat protein